MHIILVRHGQSYFNVHESRSLNSGLTVHGRDQCIKTGNFLRDYIEEKCYSDKKIDVIFHHSPFDRTTESSDIIYDRIMWKAIFEKTKYNTIIRQSNWDLREHIFAYEDSSNSIRTFPKEEHDALIAENLPLKITDEWVVERTDKDHEVLERVSNVVKHLFSFDNETVHVIIGHGTPTQVLYEMLTGNYLERIPEWDRSFKNCSVTHIETGGEKPLVHLLKHTDFLEDNQ
jgi:broad specificity phosphatase PhoE